MSKAFRWLGYGVGAIAVLIVAIVLLIWVLSERALAEKAEPAKSQLASPTAAQLADGPRQLNILGCVSCHGRIDEMDTVTQMTPLSMNWCLDCHRNPDPNRRPVSEVTNMKWTPPRDVVTLAAQLDRARRVNPPTDCSGCHR